MGSAGPEGRRTWGGRKKAEHRLAAQGRPGAPENGEVCTPAALPPEASSGTHRKSEP